MDFYQILQIQPTRREITFHGSFLVKTGIASQYFQCYLPEPFLVDLGLSEKLGLVERWGGWKGPLGSQQPKRDTQEIQIPIHLREKRGK